MFLSRLVVLCCPALYKCHAVLNTINNHRHTTGNIYEGEWKDKKRHGRGKFFYKTGEVYGE